MVRRKLVEYLAYTPDGQIPCCLIHGVELFEKGKARGRYVALTMHPPPNSVCEACEKEIKNL